MKIIRATIRRFRGIPDVAEIDFDICNAIVGRNDSGKSTILKAIDLFLNDSEATAEMRNSYSDNPVCEVELIFTTPQTSIVIDEVISTTFKEEELLDENGNLRIKKTWDTSKSKIKPELLIYIKSYDEDNFIMKSEKELISLCKKYGIATSKGNGEEYNNVEKRMKLREEFNSRGIIFHFDFEKLSATGSSRSKLIYDEIQRVLPRFEYFYADTSLSESDAAYQKYFKKLTADILGKGGITGIEDSVRIGVGSVLRRITEKINLVLPEEQKVEPSITFNWANLVTTSFKTTTEDKSIPLNFRGDGFRRLTMMSFFEFLAEENTEIHQNIIFGFEEPETFLHPSAQEQLYEKLEAMTESGYQVILTTHSPIIVAKCHKNHLIHITSTPKSYTVEQRIPDFSSIIDDLGISPGNQFIREFEKGKVIVLVEGRDDAHAFHYTSNTYKENRILKNNFTDLDIVLIPIGGCDSIKHWHALNILADLGKRFYIVQDSDKDNILAHSSNEETLLSLGYVKEIDFWVTRKRAIENYINKKTIEREFPGIEISYDDFSHMKKLCKNHPLAASLGGSNFTKKHFSNQTFDELRESFKMPDGSDEFVNIYHRITSKLEDY